MKVIARQSQQLDQLAGNTFWNRIDVRLDDDRAEEVGARPLLMPSLGMDVLASGEFEESLELGQRDVAELPRGH
ncbi:MAG: hypothetical protein IPG92_11790 [Flavobacteriales bacterium]|nr:hypothetical protein [Flavobacteriales bacterium]